MFTTIRQKVTDSPSVKTRSTRSSEHWIGSRSIYRLVVQVGLRQAVTRSALPCSEKGAKCALQLRRTCRRPLPARRTRHIRDREQHEQPKRHVCSRAIFRQIVSNEGRNPCECESRICPFFELRQSGNNERNCPQRFSNAEQDP